MAISRYRKTLLTGGTTDAMDGLDGNTLNDGDITEIYKLNVWSIYVLDADSGASESSPDVIAPDTNPGSKRWILQYMGNNKFDGQYYSEQYTCTTTLDWNNGNVQYIQLTNGSQTFTFSNPKAGARYLLYLKQPASGAAGTVLWPAAVSWSGATAPTLTATNSSIDMISLPYDGTNLEYYGTYSLNH